MSVRPRQKAAPDCKHSASLHCLQSVTSFAARTPPAIASGTPCARLLFAGGEADGRKSLMFVGAAHPSGPPQEPPRWGYPAGPNRQHFFRTVDVDAKEMAKNRIRRTPYINFSLYFRNYSHLNPFLCS